MSGLWIFFSAFLIAGIIFSIVGFRKFKDPFDSKNWLFIGALLFIAPVLLTVGFYTIIQFTSPSKIDLSRFLFGIVFFEVIILAVILFARFGMAKDHVARNIIFGFSVFLFIQLLVPSLFFTSSALGLPTSGSSGDYKRYKDFTYQVEDGEIAISYYSGHDQIVVVPSNIYWKKVTRIKLIAFAENDITGIVIPDSIKTIDAEAFQECKSLTDITIPDSVTSIGEKAFYLCSALTEINVSSGNPNYTSVEGVLYSKDMTTLIACPPGKSGSVTVPDTVRYIGVSAFSGCSKLTSVTMPQIMTSIGAYAFYGCSSLTSITIPVGVTKIEDATFRGCTGLTTVTIPEGVTGIGLSAFNGCSSLTAITLPKSLTGFGKDAFAYCDKMVIHCPLNSGAQLFAEMNGFDFVLVD